MTIRRGGAQDGKTHRRTPWGAGLWRLVELRRGLRRSAGGAGDRVAGAGCGEVRDRGEMGIAVGVVVTEARLVVGTWIQAVRRMGMLQRRHCFLSGLWRYHVVLLTIFPQRFSHLHQNPPNTFGLRVFLFLIAMKVHKMVCWGGLKLLAK